MVTVMKGLENTAWEYISQIPIGTVVSWIVFIVLIISALGVGFIKLYKIFEKTKNAQEENIEFKTLVKKHDESLALIITELKELKKDREEQKIRELKKVRYSIIRAGEEAVKNESLTIRELKSLEELYESYTSFDEDGHPANGYCRTLMNKVRRLEVIGKLDENDEDIY